MKKLLKSVSFLLLLSIFVSCSKDKPSTEQQTDGNYVLWLQVGSWPNTSQYVVGVSSVDTGSVSLSGNGREVTGMADYGIIPHKGYYYYINEEEGSFVKFELKNNNWTAVKEVPYVHVNFASATYTWVDDKTLIIVGLATFFQLSVSSCKTCKCPAYSQTTIQYSSNLNDLIT